MGSPSLQRKRYAEMTRHDAPSKTLAGMEPGSRAFEGALAVGRDEREAAADGAIDGLQVVEVHPARGVGQVAVARGADANHLAHHAEENRRVVGEQRVVVQRVADGAPGELGADALLGEQFVVEPRGALVGDDGGAALRQAVAREPFVGDARVDVDERLVDSDDVSALGRELARGRREE
jgi:hypothetical protein